MTDMIPLSRSSAEALLTALASVEDLAEPEQLALHDLECALATDAPWVAHPEMVVYWRACIHAVPADLADQINRHARLMAQEMRLAHLDPDNPHTILAAAFGAASVLGLTMRADRQGTISPDAAHVASELARQTFTSLTILGLEAGIQ